MADDARRDEDLDAAADQGVEDVLDEVGPEGTTPAPDPLKHASPYVDQAKLAEAGSEAPDPSGALNDADLDDAEFGAPGLDDGDGVYADEVDDGAAAVAAAPDRLERDLAPRRHAHAAPGGAPTERRSRGRFLTFLGHCVDELRRVQWPDRRQVGQGTAVTLGFVVLAGGYLGLMDAIFKPLVDAIL